MKRRALTYAVLVPLVMVLAFMAGLTHFDNTCNADPEATDCDVGVFVGAAWALKGLGLLALGALAVEFALGFRHPRRPQDERSS